MQFCGHRHNPKERKRNHMKCHWLRIRNSSDSSAKYEYVSRMLRFKYAPYRMSSENLKCRRHQTWEIDIFLPIRIHHRFAEVSAIDRVQDEVTEISHRNDHTSRPDCALVYRSPYVPINRWRDILCQRVVVRKCFAFVNNTSVNDPKYTRKRHSFTKSSFFSPASFSQVTKLFDGG